VPEERLQKILAAVGVASRRAAEALIAEGRVTLNGRVARLGDHADPDTASIEVDGIPVGVGAALVHLALHKPAGVTSTTADRHAVATVLDYLPTALVPDGARLYPVGRLDQDSEGLLLLTNDGPWAERVLHPRFGVEREYAVAVRVPLTDEQVRVLLGGVALEEGLARLAAPLRGATSVETRKLVGLLDPQPDPSFTWYRAVLAQGWKRQLRRMFAVVGAPVARLVRVRIGIVRIDGLPSGRARNLKAPEIRGLGAGQIRPRVDPKAPDAAGSARPAKAHPAGPGRSGPRRPAGTGAPRPLGSGPGRPVTGRPGAPKKGVVGRSRKDYPPAR